LKLARGDQLGVADVLIGRIELDDGVVADGVDLHSRVPFLTGC
jgi:hypothetical protein